MDYAGIVSCELLVLSKLSSYAFLSQLLVINHPAEPAGYLRSWYGILVSYIIIMFYRDDQTRNLGGGVGPLERVKTHAVRLFFNFWAYLAGLVAYSILGQIGHYRTEDAVLASCSSWNNTPVHLIPWNTVTTFHHTLQILTCVRFGHVFLLLTYNAAQYAVQQL